MATARMCTGHWVKGEVSWTSTPPGPSQEDGGLKKEEEIDSAAGAAAVVSGFSEYLLSSSPWPEAPYCPDYVGPVVVAKTTDGCGRGLFTTEDVRAEKDHHFRRQIYTLAHTHEAQNVLPVPTMDLLTSPSSSCTNISCDNDLPSVDLTRIMDIMVLNSFEGEFPNKDPQKPKTRLSGLWLIPSLINHSCHRNASRLIVGGAMVIHAAAEIRKGEEITITYVDILAPLQARQKAFQDMRFGFSCICKRCVLEQSLETCLADVSREFCSLHVQVTEEVYLALFSPTSLSSKSSFPACTNLNKLFETLSEKVDAIDGLSELEKKWVLGGYSSAFLGKWLVNGYTTRFADLPSFVNHDVVAVVAAMQATIPG
ncbi:hypothetical protein GOP47_0001998 [Adiantum capillus-veneris]|uniref:SET domain-containing protein n=1 Tax=Adiantum capillus-veneris TaxID=13818 RepID=A0A9D4ZR78_ADICA|nr:hypothetical protein GOP47_0001998 [Adiantum capillus-veneris]